MFKRWREWRANRQAVRMAKAVEAGWCWAAGELLRGRDPGVHLYPPFYEDAHLRAFDDGAAAALQEWKRRGLGLPL